MNWLIPIWFHWNYLFSGQVFFVLFPSHGSAINLLFDDRSVVTRVDARRGNWRRGRGRRHQAQPSPPSSSCLIVVIRRKIWRIFWSSFFSAGADGQRGRRRSRKVVVMHSVGGKTRHFQINSSEVNDESRKCEGNKILIWLD